MWCVLTKCSGLFVKLDLLSLPLELRFHKAAALGDMMLTGVLTGLLGKGTRHPGTEEVPLEWVCVCGGVVAWCKQVR